MQLIKKLHLSAQKHIFNFTVHYFNTNRKKIEEHKGKLPPHIVGVRQSLTFCWVQLKTTLPSNFSTYLELCLAIFPPKINFKCIFSVFCSDYNYIYTINKKTIKTNI